MVNTNRSKLLDSGYYENETWGALHKAWKGYIIAKNKNEYDKLEHYASIIQKLQHELGLTVSSFHELGLSCLKFHSSQFNSKYPNNNSNKETEQEELLKDRNDDDEYFDEDFNIGDRFTS